MDWPDINECAHPGFDTPLRAAARNRRPDTARPSSTSEQTSTHLCQRVCYYHEVAPDMEEEG